MKAKSMHWHKQESMIDNDAHERWLRRQFFSRPWGLHQIVIIFFGFLLISATRTCTGVAAASSNDNVHYDKVQTNDNELHKKNTLVDVKEPSSFHSSASPGHTIGDGDNDEVDIYFRRMETPISSVQMHAQVFTVKLAFRMIYVDQDTADLLSKGRQSDPIVHRLCSAVNMQSGGLEATTSAYEDNLLLSTRSNYVFPRTGCRILDTNRIYYDDVGEAAIAMEVLLSQEISISISSDDFPGNNTASPLQPGPISYDRVYKHVSRGFSGGTGGRNKFKMLLMAEDERTGLTILPFFELEDVMLIRRLSNPVPRPTLPPSPVPTRYPTNSATETKRPSTSAPTAIETKRPSTSAPTVTPTMAPSSSPTTPAVPSKSPQQQSTPPGDSILTNSPTNDNDRPLAPGKDGISIDEFPSPGPGPVINRASGPQGSGDQDDIIPIAVVAAAAGAVAGIFVVAMLSLYRYRKELREYQKRDRDRTCSQLPVATAVPTEMNKGRTKGWVSNPAHNPNVPRAREIMETKQHLVGARPPPPIPAVVNDEERSLAESTLGDLTAGRKLWSVPPPPVQFLQSSWIPKEGRRGRVPPGPTSGVSVAISQISSLDSGTIGAGGGAATIGEFSLEAAIKDDDDSSGRSSRDEEGGGIDQPGINRDKNTSDRSDGITADDGGNLGGSGESDDHLRLPMPSENSSSKAAEGNLPPHSEAASNATAPNSTPSSLVGTASLFEASTLSLSDEATGTSASLATNNFSANASNVTPDHNVHVGHPEPPLDLTPRISGGGGGPWKSPANIFPENDDEEASNTDDLSYTLPQTITPERKRSMASETSSRPWSRAFAEGTAAVLSASFRGAENLILPSTTQPQVSRCGTPRPLESPGDFPELGPLVDPPVSDHVSQVDEVEVANIMDKNLSEMEEGRQSRAAETPNKDPGHLTSTSKDTGDSPGDDHRWLLDAVTGALGLPARGADMESLSGRSNPSLISAQSAPVLSSTPGQGPGKRRKSSRRTSTRSVCSRGSRHSHRSQGSEESRSVAKDLRRLEVQLKMLNDREKEELATGASASGEVKSTPPPPAASPLSRHSATSSIRLVVQAPPGRLGVILANRSDDQRGTVVSALRTSSALVGKILPGDILVAIDGLDVSEMHVSEVTAIMSNKSQQEKVLTVVTPSK